MYTFEMIYFRDTNVCECWRNSEAMGWEKLAPDSFDDMHHDKYRYWAMDSKPENWLGEDRRNPMPRIAW